MDDSAIDAPRTYRQLCCCCDESSGVLKMAESRGQQQNQLDILEDEWSSRCNVLQAKVDMLQEDNRLKRHTANRLQDRMKKQVKRLALVRQALKKEKNALLGMRANTDTVMKDMGSVIKSTLHEVEVMAVRLKQETQARKDGDHLRKTLKAQLEVLEKEWMNDVARLEEKLRQQAKQINDARDEEVKKMEENHRGLQENLEKQVQEEVNKNKELHDRLESLQNRIKLQSSDGEKKNLKLLADLEDVKATLKKRDEQCSGLQSELAALKQLLQESQKKLTAAQGEITSLKKDNSGLRVNLDAVQRSRKREADGYEKELGELRIELQKCKKEGEEWKRQVDSLSGDEAKTRQVLEEMKRELDGAGEKIEEQRAEMASLRNAQNSLTGESQTRLDAAKADYQASIERLKAQHSHQIEEMRKAHQAELEALKSTCSKMEARHGAAMAGSLKEMESAKENARVSDAETRKAHSLLEAERERFAVLMESLNAANREKAEAEEALANQSSFVNKFKGQLKEKQWEIDRLNAKLEEAAQVGEKETSEGLEMLEKHLIKLSNKIRTKDQEINNLEATVHRQCKERQGLLEEIRKLRRSSSN